jgi:hypothetical protein
MKEFWTKWRRELIRGGFLFAAVFGVGLWVTNVARTGRDRFVMGRDRIVSEIGDQLSGLNVNFDGPDRNHAAAFQWHQVLRPGQTIWVRNLTGPIEVEPAPGDRVEIEAERSWIHSDPDDVRIVTIPDAQGVTICALWSRQSKCGIRGNYNVRQHGGRTSDVAVKFVVRVPKNVVVDASTINGGIQVTGATGAVSVGTVNGPIDVQTTGGPLKAKTINGSVAATLGAGQAGASIETINGSVTLELPANTNAELDASSVMGQVSTDFPLQANGMVETKHVRGAIGRGGPPIKVTTVHGRIEISQASPSGGASTAPRTRVRVVKPAIAPPSPSAPPPQPR